MDPKRLIRVAASLPCKTKIDSEEGLGKVRMTADVTQLRELFLIGSGSYSSI